MREAPATTPRPYKGSPPPGLLEPGRYIPLLAHADGEAKAVDRGGLFDSAVQSPGIRGVRRHHGPAPRIVPSDDAERLKWIALPDRPVPSVAGVDEFALLKGRRYATIIIDADTGERIEVLPDCASIAEWVIWRDDSGGFAQMRVGVDGREPTPMPAPPVHLVLAVAGVARTLAA